MVNTWSFPGVSVFLIGPGIGFMLLGKIFMPIIHLKTQNNTKPPNPVPWLASRSPSSERPTGRNVLVLNWGEYTWMWMAPSLLLV